MNKEKVFIEGYEVGFLVDTTGAREKKIQVASGEIVSIDERFIYKSIEREKVTIPKLVADWIEQCKEKEKSLLNSLLYTPEGVNSWVDDPDNQETFALAWMFGYTIKKEPRYFVEIKATKHCFTRDGNGRIFFSLAYKSPFTKAELKKDGFGWVFNCPGIELLEVEE